jgi:hypothetical protein
MSLKQHARRRWRLLLRSSQMRAIVNRSLLGTFLRFTHEYSAQINRLVVIPAQAGIQFRARRFAAILFLDSRLRENDRKTRACRNSSHQGFAGNPQGTFLVR